MRKIDERINQRIIENLKEILKNMKNVVYYRYRTATIYDILYRIENFNNFEELNNIVKNLYKKAGVKEDNHEVFAIELESKAKLYIMRTDYYLIVGLSIKEISW